MRKASALNQKNGEKTFRIFNQGKEILHIRVRAEKTRTNHIPIGVRSLCFFGRFAQDETHLQRVSNDTDTILWGETCLHFPSHYDIMSVQNKLKTRVLPVFGRGFRQHALNVCAARGAFYAEISFGAGTVSASGGIEMSEFINVKSEIGRLRRVMLHRPGIELQNLMPDYLERMLAEDTPDVRRAGEEHDVFAGILRANGVDVVYIEDMFKEVVKDDAVRKAFIKDFVELGVRGLSLSKAVTEYLESVPYDKLFDAVAKGITRADLSGVADKPIQYYVKEDYPFLTDPLPNLYFTRDISFCLGTGMAISAMSMPARMRETLFVRYIHKYSEYFGKGAVDMLYDFNCGCGIEGGDVLSLSDKCVAIGSGERTSVAAVERLALTLFKRGYERVLLFKNPSSRTYMHLDVLMTHIDYDKFLAHPCIAHKWFDIYELTPAANGGINVSCTTDGTAKILERALGIDKVTFVEMGGGDPIQYRREHWNMGSNSLAMAPGSIITYDRNIITNELIDKAGVKVSPIPGGELSRGRGGPRCMSMPMLRDEIK